jgi:hypothetical protein
VEKSVWVPSSKGQHVGVAADHQQAVHVALGDAVGNYSALLGEAGPGVASWLARATKGSGLTQTTRP